MEHNTHNSAVFIYKRHTFNIVFITQPPRLVPFRVTRNLGGFFIPKNHLNLIMLTKLNYCRPALTFDQQLDTLERPSLVLKICIVIKNIISLSELIRDYF